MSLAVNTVHVGDVRELLAQMDDESVNCVVTSPPYWGLRDYGVTGQMGLEDTPAEYVTKMVEVFREVRRVLRSDGTCWVNLGDCYANSGRGGIGDASTLDGSRRNQNESRRDGVGNHNRVVENLKPKDMVGIPWRVAFALQADGWWLRSDIIWHKPNPMPESVDDRPTKAHEYLFLLTKSDRYQYDADAIKEPVTGGSHARGSGVNPKAGKNEQTGDRTKDGFNAHWRTKQNASFSAAVSGLVDVRNKRSVWSIPTEPYAGSHFATFPRKLVEPYIKAGCPAGGVVLDPFGGSGTVGQVAADLGRNWILLELNPEYAELARARVAQRTELSQLELTAAARSGDTRGAA